MIDTKPALTKSGTYVLYGLHIALVLSDLRETSRYNNVDTRCPRFIPHCLTIQRGALPPYLYYIYIHLRYWRKTRNFAVDNSNLNDNEKKNLNPATIHTDGYSHNVCHNTSK